MSIQLKGDAFMGLFGGSKGFFGGDSTILFFIIIFLLLFDGGFKHCIDP
jgi:hypothetical protein